MSPDRQSDRNPNLPPRLRLSVNLQHRHLKESQRAMFAAQLADMKPGRRTYLASIDARPRLKRAGAERQSRIVQVPAR